MLKIKGLRCKPTTAGSLGCFKSYIKVQWLLQMVDVLLQLGRLAPPIGCQVRVLQALKTNVVVALPMAHKVHNLPDRSQKACYTFCQYIGDMDLGNRDVGRRIFRKHDDTCRR
jgi:hypothetical protein